MSLKPTVVSPTKPTPTKPTPTKPTPVNVAVISSLFIPKTTTTTTSANEFDVIAVPTLDLCMPEFALRDVKLKPGQDITLTITIRNLSTTKPVTEKLALRVLDDDRYFQASSVIIDKKIPAAGDIQVNCTLKAKGRITNLNHLPEMKEILLIKPTASPTQLHKITSIHIQIPIDPFIRYLKEEFAPMKIFLWGLFGTGKSSFINSIATLYNENSNFPDKKLTPAFSRPAGATVTDKLKTYEYNNLKIVDSWGWEEAHKELYNDLLFQLMIGGKLENDFKMDRAKDINVLNLPDVPQDPVDIVFFFVTVNAVQSDPYIEQMNHFIKQTQKLNIPFLILVTQIDRVDPSLKTNPYDTNPTIEDLVNQVKSKIDIDDSFIVPVVNYTSEKERNWAMDRAAFVTIYRAFQTRLT